MGVELLRVASSTRRTPDTPLVVVIDEALAQHFSK
jgi:hypothetical protein